MIEIDYFKRKDKGSFMKKIIWSKSLKFLLLCIAVCAMFFIKEVSFAKNKVIDKKIIKNDKNFTVEMEYGINGYAVYDAQLPVKVTVTSKENFTGYIKVRMNQDYGVESVAYGEKVSLAAGEKKTVTFVLQFAPPDNLLFVDVLDKNSKLLYSEENVCIYEKSDAIGVVGILSDDFSALNYFDGVPIEVGTFKGNSSIIEITKEDIWTDGTGLSCLDYMIIDNYDTSQLSEKQYHAIKDWVNQGGVLILSLGPNYNKVMNIFKDDFVTGKFGSIKKKNLVWNDTLSNQEIQVDKKSNQEDFVVTLNDVDTIEFQLDHGKELIDFAKDQTAYSKKVGKGEVVTLGYALGLEPIVTYENREFVAMNLLMDATGSKQIAENKTISEFIDDALLSNSSGIKVPNPIIYACILIMYIILVGPVLYSILKKKNKREYIWVMIPIVSFIFVVIIYVTGLFYCVRKPVLSTFTILSLNDGLKEETVYVDLICPKPKKYTISLNDKYSSFKTKSTDEYYFNSTNEEPSMTVLNNDGGIELLVNSNRIFSENKFQVSNIDVNDKGKIDLDLKCYTDGFEGTVTNNTKYDLKEVVVSYEMKFYKVGELKKGKQAKIDKNNLIAGTGYGSLMVYENLFWDKKEIALSNAAHEMMERKVIEKVNQQSNLGSVWGIIDQYQPSVVGNHKAKDAGNAIILQWYEADYEDVKGCYYPSIHQFITSEYSDSDLQFYGSNATIFKDVELIYTFRENDRITCLHNFSYTVAKENTYLDFADVYFYNLETNQYDLMYVDTDTVEGEELKKYLRNNQIRVMYRLTSSNSVEDLPTITAKGEK